MFRKTCINKINKMLHDAFDAILTLSYMLRRNIILSEMQILCHNVIAARPPYNIPYHKSYLSPV